MKYSKPYLMERLDMMTVESPEFKDLIAAAVIDREIEEKEKRIEEKNKEMEEKDKKIKKLEKELKKYN